MKTSAILTVNMGKAVRVQPKDFEAFIGENIAKTKNLAGNQWKPKFLSDEIVN